MDNGLSERQIKPFVTGRKNWMFCDSVAGAKAAQILFSLVETCELHRIDTYAYLRLVLTEFPYTKTISDIEKNFAI